MGRHFKKKKRKVYRTCEQNNNENVNNTTVNPTQQEPDIVDPTRTIVNTTINPHVVRHIHPTNVVNVNRDVYRIEHYYPVEVSNVNDTVVENFNCGSDLNNPRCRRMNCRNTD
ncbi:CotD family spore coat protein [Metabacillus malikii]|uniref:Spore coat protein D n=1 Tax=Metabacillus malikii TaxID=1504265 RepID=A0ABT9ZC71_9BACI|nr:CotD family spore coat protein [Metabacillus malikii]MDQ0229871.1 spore coat protein D [Metabacillus malikii]